MLSANSEFAGRRRTLTAGDIAVHFPPRPRTTNIARTCVCIHACVRERTNERAEESARIGLYNEECEYIQGESRNSIVLDHYAVGSSRRLRAMTWFSFSMNLSVPWTHFFHDTSFLVNEINQGLVGSSDIGRCNFCVFDEAYPFQFARDRVERNAHATTETLYDARWSKCRVPLGFLSRQLCCRTAIELRGEIRDLR